MPEGDQTADPETAPASPPRTPEAAPEAQDRTGKPKRRFSELPRSAQAAMLCDNPVFQRWLLRHNFTNYAADQLATAADVELKMQLNIESKRLLDTNDWDAGEFDTLHARYRAETGQEAEAR